MSESEEHDGVHVSADGVRVLKRFAEDRFPVPAIVFEISSGREEPVTLCFSDQVPQGMAVDDLGFHPDYGSEHWTIERDRITFEHTLEPNATYTTVYGIRTADDVGQILDDPTIESVDPPLSGAGEDVVSESDDALVEDSVSQGVESDETNQTVTTAELDIPATLDAGSLDETHEADAGAEQPAASDTASGSESTVEPTAEESLVARFATELRADSVPQEDLDLLREVLAEQYERPRSRTARLNQLQQDVADLRAYTGALEEFLDENGAGAELIDSFDDRIDEIEAELDRIDEIEAELTEIQEWRAQLIKTLGG